MKEEIIANFQYLIEHLNLAISTVNNETERINDELKHWNAKISIDELRQSLLLLLDRITNWYDVYKKAGNICQIDLKDYDLVCKELAYLIGECSLIDDLYIEGIDFTIGSIGAEMVDEIKKGEINNG